MNIELMKQYCNFALEDVSNNSRPNFKKFIYDVKELIGRYEQIIVKEGPLNSERMTLGENLTGVKG